MLERKGKASCGQRDREQVVWALEAVMMRLDLYSVYDSKPQEGSEKG